MVLRRLISGVLISAWCLVGISAAWGGEPPGLGVTSPPENRDVLCGPHCLYLLLRLRQIPVSHEDVLKYMPSDPEGMSLLELKQACADFGLDAEVRRCSKEDLRKIDFPVIAHMYYGGLARGAYHYVVMTRRVKDDRVEIVDGTTGEVKQYPIATVSHVWTGYLLVPSDSPGYHLAAGVVLAISSGVIVLGGWLWKRRTARAIAVRSGVRRSTNVVDAPC